METCTICEKGLAAYFERSNAKSVKIDGVEYLICLSCQGKYDSDQAIMDYLGPLHYEIAQKAADAAREASIDAERLAKFILTTTSKIEGREIIEYLGIVGAQTIQGINIFKDLFAGVRNVVGGRSQALQKAMKTMREEALKELKEEAFGKGANAVVGIKIDFDEYSEGMLMLTVSGTAVKINE